MNSALKRFVDLVATVLVAPAWLVYCLESWLLGAGKVFPGWSQAFSLLPGMPGIYLRRAFYRLVLPQCERDACISFGTVFSHPTARIGKKVYIGVYCGIGDVTIEDDALIASHVSIANGPAQHGIERLDVPIREQPGEFPHVTIGRDTWIGDRATILVNVGKHCVVGAGAVVTRTIPDYAIAVGVPARVVSSRLPSGLAEAMNSDPETLEVTKSTN